ncbi:hypothetical protein GCM10009744_42700 [Kribbella alba]|uniref:Uncharacterized protein n=1 Tax=Kribbella alba TaxID=190197 RepID=A0ABN2FIM3_9ACTN
MHLTGVVGRGSGYAPDRGGGAGVRICTAVFYDSRDREVARFDSNVHNPVDGYNADRQPIFRK